jgi:predicted signal transduction protein with EAL and GGDEF domain
MSVTAEGAETSAQLSTLKAMRSDHAQGYLLGRPVEPRQLEHFLAGSSTSSHTPDVPAQSVPTWDDVEMADNR